MGCRIGIVLAGSRKLNTSAVKFLVLKLNSLQKTFQYEFLPSASPVFARLRAGVGSSPKTRDLSERLLPLERLLRGRKISVREKNRMRPAIPDFFRQYKVLLLKDIRRFKLAERRRAPDYLVLVTVGRFADNYYSMREGSVSILALGNWKSRMAPPSLLESILTLMLRESVAAVSPLLRGSVHLGTRGCLCDFTPLLADVRFKVLQGFICDYCRDALVKDGCPQLVNDLPRLLEKRWVGKRTDYSSPSGILSKLGYELFLTKGFKPSPWEKIRAKLQEEGVKEAVRIVFYVAITLLLGLEWFKNRQITTLLLEKLKK